MGGWSTFFQTLPCNDSSAFRNESDVMKLIWSSPFGFSSHVILLYTFAVLIIGSTIAMIFFTFERVGYKEDAPNRRIHFSVLFDHNIRRVFTSQKEDSLNTMLYGVRAALGCHCERPPVLMFLSTPSSTATAMAIAQRLTQAFLVAKGSEIGANKLQKVVMNGSKYQAMENYWDFYRGLSKRLAQLKVAIVSEFQRLHPQVALVLCNLADDAFSPYPKAMILLLTDMDNYFTERELQIRSPMELAESFTSYITNGFLDRDVVADLQRTICGRPVFIEPDQHLELI